MLEMLKLEVQAKKRSLTIARGSNFNNDRTFFHQSDFTTSGLSNLAARKQCVYCGLSNHLPRKCLKVTNKQERKTVLKSKNLCYICLESGHIAKFCSSGYVCKKCDKKHHVSICSYDPRSPLNSQQTHQNDATLINFSNNQNNLLLQTAYVEVSDLKLKNKHFVNALFDSGSQRTYISSDSRNKLGLKTLRKERIFIETFGNKYSSELSVDVVPLKIISDQKIVTIEAIWTPVNSADLLNQNIQHVSTRYPHFTGLKLADTSKNLNKGIEILIGSDYYYNFVFGEVLKRKVNEPVAINSLIGWILSGRFDYPTSANLNSVACLTDSYRNNVRKYC